MKTRHSLAILMLFVCLNIFGQQPKIVPMQGQPQTASTQVTTNHHETIKQLQAENEAIQKQLEKMEKEIEVYRGDVRTKETEIHEDQGHWLTLLSIVIGAIVSILGIGLGVITPLVLNYRNEKALEKMLEDAKSEAQRAKEAVEKIQPQVKEATDQATAATSQANEAKQAVADIEKIKEQVSKIQEKISADTAAAEKAAKEAKASQLFTEAFNEKDTSKAIELYNQAIEKRPDFADAFNNRGILKKQMGDQSGSLSDYDTAISLKPDYAEAYINRGNLKSDMGDQVGSLSDYDKAISLKPDYAEAYINRGLLKSEMGDQVGSLSDYDTAISLKPDYATAYNNRAQCYRKIAESEQDPAKKEELIAMAEVDEKIAESLKKSGTA